ncbi:S8 family serine peptidase [[Phormidium] sp. ETS-05]|uniref:S8 family serine peptidase n=1 Tax=[Phormidium] sp. ETS-05 TaxID=222819 RepID=UPI0018EF1775|nr:S8 family serine peptidase [[Phormidium] sp. ETS-05]
MLDIIGTSGNDLLDGTLGDDFLHCLGGNDVVRGLAGSDLIHGNQGADILNGNTGNDIIYAGQGDDTAYGGKDNDFVCGDLGNDWLYGNLGDDTVLGMTGDDRLWGNEGADILNGNQGDDIVDGGEGNDFLYGGKGNDVLIGGLGDDTLCGDLGIDTLTGGEGADRFVIRKGIGGATLAEADVITDFVQDEDAIALEDGLTFDDLEIYQGSGENAGDTIIREKATGQYLAILQQFDGELVVDEDNPSQIVASESLRQSIDHDWMKNLPIFFSSSTSQQNIHQPEQQVFSPLESSNVAVVLPNPEVQNNTQADSLDTPAADNINPALAGMQQPDNTQADSLDTPAVDNINPALADIQPPDNTQADSLDTPAVDNINPALADIQPPDNTQADSLDTPAVDNINPALADIQPPDNTQENLPPNSLKFSFPQTSYQLGEPIAIANGQVYDAQDFIDLDRVDFWLQKDGGNWIKLDESVTTFDLTGTTVGWAKFSYELTGIEAGSYQLKAIAYDKSGAASEPDIQSFTVESVADLQISNSLENAIDLGVLGNFDTVNDSVGDSNSDYYRFELNDSSYFNLVLNQLSADANVQLIQDSNNNGLVDDAEVLANSINSGTTAEGISRILEAGTYYIQVSPSESNDNTNYQLNLSANSTEALPIDPLTGAEYMPGELLVKFNSNVAQSQWNSIAGEYGFNTIEPLGDPNQSPDSILNQWAFLEANSEVDVQSALIQFSENSNVEVSQFNYLISMNGSWGSNPVNNQADDIGNNIKEIKARDAWPSQPGSKKITVAVLDTGVDYTHPDLAANSAGTGNIWRNDPIFKGDVFNSANQEFQCPGLDYTGKIFEDKTPPEDMKVSEVENQPDTNGHGTHVAGIIGALPNDKGVAGVSPNVGIMPVEITDNEGKSSSKIAGKAIQWAIQNGADVINASWSVKNPGDRYLGDMISAAQKQDVLFVISTPNQSAIQVINSYPSIPTGSNIYAKENVISVGAKGTTESKPDLYAPGDGIESTLPDNKYGSMTGNSMAAAHVSGAAALLLAKCPALTASDIKAILKETADGGLLDVDEALKSVNFLDENEATESDKFKDVDVDIPMGGGSKSFTGSVSSGNPDYYRLNYFIVSGVSWNTVKLETADDITAEIIDEWGNVIATTNSDYFQQNHYDKDGYFWQKNDNSYTAFNDYQISDYMYLRVMPKEEQNINYEYELKMHLIRGNVAKIG